MLLLLALFTGDAMALQRPQSGPTFELGVGPSAAGRPLGFGLAGQVSAGWWFGPYDDEYALGRFWVVAVTLRSDMAVRGDVRLVPQVEIRRGMDLFVAAPHFFVACGPVLSLAPVADPGLAARVGGGFKFRRTKYFGFTARLEGGVDVLAGTVSPAVGLTLGVGWSAPAAR